MLRYGAFPSSVSSPQGDWRRGGADGNSRLRQRGGMSPLATVPPVSSDRVGVYHL